MLTAEVDIPMMRREAEMARLAREIAAVPPEQLRELIEYRRQLNLESGKIQTIMPQKLNQIQARYLATLQLMLFMVEQLRAVVPAVAEVDLALSEAVELFPEALRPAIGATFQTVREMIHEPKPTEQT